MPKQCPKCSYIRNESDTAPSTECPSCGVIFSKFKSTCPRCKYVASAEEITKPGTCPECGVDINWFIQSTREQKRSGAIRCSDCSEQVYDGATTCPNGHLQIFSKDRTKQSVHSQKWVGIVFVVLIALGMMVYTNKSPNPTKSPQISIKPQVTKKDGTVARRTNDLEELCKDYSFYRAMAYKYSQEGNEQEALKARRDFQQINVWLSQYADEDVSKACST